MFEIVSKYDIMYMLQGLAKLGRVIHLWWPKLIGHHMHLLGDNLLYREGNVSKTACPKSYEI